MVVIANERVHLLIFVHLCGYQTSELRNRHSRTVQEPQVHGKQRQMTHSMVDVIWAIFGECQRWSFFALSYLHTVRMSIARKSEYTMCVSCTRPSPRKGIAWWQFTFANKQTQSTNACRQCLPFPFTFFKRACDFGPSLRWAVIFHSIVVQNRLSASGIFVSISFHL